MRVVSSTERETTARVSDDREDRDREFHEVITTVDVSPDDITAAWLHTKTVFGVEAARVARILYLNLGLHASRSAQSKQMRIAGNDVTASLFTVCRHCGSVFGIRGDTRDPDDANHHRAWCKVRSGARAPKWDTLALTHELETEAVRILLPIAEFEDVERIASFKAALLLGLRDSFGGDPSHLRILQSEFPAPGGDGDLRNRFVIIHDTVPGGTGYLQRLADPTRLREILQRAVELISTCDCQTRGMPGCHKCLYTSVGRNELPLVTREVALDMLDEILTGWQMKEAEKGTITGVNLSQVRQSELERMFKALLHRWPQDRPVRITPTPDPDHANRTRFEVRFQDGPRWEIREQVNLVEHKTVPDFYATRLDKPDRPPVAIYLDGWEFHGSNHEQVDKDAVRRASVRASGTPVWVLDWTDVKGALTAVNQGSKVGPVTPLGNAARHQATQGAKQANSGDHPAFEALGQGAFEQLMTYLEHPDPGAWRSLAMTTALAPGKTGVQMNVESLEVALAEAAGGKDVTVADIPTDIAAIRWESQNGLACVVLVENGQPEPHIVLTSNTGADPDRTLWTDWLHLGNLFQHLGNRSLITTTRTFVPSGAPPAAPLEQVISAEPDELLADVFDRDALPLARAALEAGFRDVEVGIGAGDEDDTPIEVAWPQAKVGILPSGGQRAAGLDDWELRFPNEWTTQSLVDALEARS